MDNKEHTIDQLSKLSACFIVQCHAAEILSRKIEQMAHSQRMVLKNDTKYAVTGIMQAAQKMQHHMEHISDWAIKAAVTEKGECGSIESYDVLQQDASDLLQLTLLWFNASGADDDARIKTESMLKLITKGQTLIDQDIIESVKVQV